MSKIFSKKNIINTLGKIATTTVGWDIDVDSGQIPGCALLFYEPKRPELIDKVAKKDLFIK